MTIILFVNQLTAQLRISWQPALCPQVKSVCRALVIIGKITRLMPVIQTHIGVTGKRQVVSSCFDTQPHATVVSGYIVIKEVVYTVHLLGHEPAHTPAGIHSISAVPVPSTKLRKQHIPLCFIHRNQPVKLAVVQGAFLTE